MKQVKLEDIWGSVDTGVVESGTGVHISAMPGIIDEQGFTNPILIMFRRVLVTAADSS